MWRTISTGHSSFSSSSMRISSGRRFLAKSRNDFKLNLRVFGAIICNSLFCGHATHFKNFAGEGWEELDQIIHNPDIGNLKDRRLGILINGDKERISLDASQ